MHCSIWTFLMCLVAVVSFALGWVPGMLITGPIVLPMIAYKWKERIYG